MTTTKLRSITKEDIDNGATNPLIVWRVRIAMKNFADEYREKRIAEHEQQSR